MKAPFSLLLLAGLASFPFNALSGQATSIGGNDQSGYPSRAETSACLVPGEKVPVSLTPAMRAMESVLAELQPGLGEQPITGMELVQRLESLGLPVVIDISARDDSFDDATIIAVPLNGVRLHDRLVSALSEHNASLQLYSNHARIMSLDVIEDADNFVTLTYDLTSIAQGLSSQEIANIICGSVDTDSWSSVGNGDQTTSFLQVNRRRLMVISGPWTGHVHVRELFAQIATLGEVRIPVLDQFDSATFGHSPPGFRGSIPVALPELVSADRESALGIWPQSAQPLPGGGSGLGGGAFSVR